MWDNHNADIMLMISKTDKVYRFGASGRSRTRVRWLQNTHITVVLHWQKLMARSRGVDPQPGTSRSTCFLDKVRRRANLERISEVSTCMILAAAVGFEPTGVISSQLISSQRAYDHLRTLPINIINWQGLFISFATNIKLTKNQQANLFNLCYIFRAFFCCRRINYKYL